MNRYEALKIAVLAHEAETDKCGALAVLHPIAVAAKLERTKLVRHVRQEDAVVVALLHDVLEDTDSPISKDDLTGIQYRGLDALTRRTWRDESYDRYIERVCDSPLACIVKLADLWHNLQPERQACLPSKERASLERRYLKARDRIWKSLGYEWWPSSTKGEGR
jgi:(p)ppGpp synthase/HD superfamily hydrolase